MNILKTVNKLCLPAQIYLAISAISILAVFFQNIGNKNTYCIGHLQTNLPCQTHTMFIYKILYVLIVTWILQKLCANGLKTISWLFVLLPFVFMFFAIISMILFLNH